MKYHFILDQKNRIFTEINSLNTIFIYHYQNDTANIPQYALFHAEKEITGSIQYHLDGSYSLVSETGKEKLSYPCGAFYPQHKWLPDIKDCLNLNRQSRFILCLKDTSNRVAVEATSDSHIFVHIYQNEYIQKPSYTVQYIPSTTSFQIGILRYYDDGSYALYLSPYQNKTYERGHIFPDHKWIHHRIASKRILPQHFFIEKTRE